VIFVQRTSVARATHELRSNRTSILTGRHPMGEHLGSRMHFTPEDMEAIRACLEGIDRNVPVTSRLRLPSYSCRTPSVLSRDIFNPAEWSAERLLFVVERWQRAAEVRIERIR
jgi:hypothetical protein